MLVQELQTILSQLKLLYNEAGAKAPASDLDRLLAIFHGHEQEEVDKFLDQLRLTLNKAIKLPNVAKANAAVVDEYLEMLSGMGRSQADFDRALSILDNDSRVGKSEMDMIAHRYTGGRPTWPSRSHAYEALKTRFAERGHQASKMSLLEKFTPW